MHFQLPPNDHHKLVFVPKGKIIDVVVDLRRHSNTYKKIFSTVLSSENKRAILIPKGFAHGFKSMIDNTMASPALFCPIQHGFDISLHSHLRHNYFQTSRWTRLGKI